MSCPRRIQGQVYLRQELTTSNEEVENIIVQQAVRCAKDQPGAVVVVANDTDVFVLLLHHYENKGLASAMFMESPVQQRSTTDVKATAQQHHAVVPGLLCYTCFQAVILSLPSLESAKELC